MLAHVPKAFWRVTATFEHDGQSLRGHLVRSGVRRGRRSRPQGRPDLRRRARGAIARRGGARPRDRERDAQAVARVGAAAVRPDQPAARGEPALLVVGAPHAVGGAALLRAPQAAHLSAHEQQVPARGLPRQRRRRRWRRSRRTERRDEGFADLAAAAARLRESGLENEASIFDNAGVSDHFAIIPTGSLPREPLTGDDKRLFDLVARRFFGAFHPPAQWERVERTTVSAGESFRTRARTLVVPGWRSVLADKSEEDETTLPALVPGADEATDVAVRALEAKSRGRRDQAAGADHRGAAALADGERGPADRRRGLLRGPAREGHRHARRRAPTSSRT